MSNETKRDVLVDAVDALADAQASGGNVGHQDANLFMAEYENALPDNMPVIPQAVGEYIKWCQSVGGVLIDAFAFTKGGITEKWIYEHGDTFARAWLLGVCKVEETGEIVKLEVNL
jgi:hypothetical protein